MDRRSFLSSLPLIGAAGAAPKSKKPEFRFRRYRPSGESRPWRIYHELKFQRQYVKELEAEVRRLGSHA